MQQTYATSEGVSSINVMIAIMFHFDTGTVVLVLPWL